MTGAASTHHVGRRLTGLTFGKRGRPAYARIYDKTEHADPDAVVREVWQRAGYDPARHGRQVWRVEFELRSEFLRHLTADDGRLPSNPGALLASHLDEVWAHVLTRWLVLREGQHGTEARTRIERRPAAAWWAALADARGLNGDAFGPVRPLTRRVPRPLDCTIFLRQAAGLLVSLGAVNGNPSLDDAVGALDAYMRSTMGDAAFAAAVGARSERSGGPTLPAATQQDEQGCGAASGGGGRPKRAGGRKALTSLREAVAGTNPDTACMADDRRLGPPPRGRTSDGGEAETTGSARQRLQSHP